MGFAYCCIRKNCSGWKVLKGNGFEPRWNGWVSPIVLGRRCRASVSRGGCSPLRLGSWTNPELLRCGSVPPARMSITELPVAVGASNRDEGFPPSTLHLPICVHLQNLWMKVPNTYSTGRCIRRSHRSAQMESEDLPWCSPNKGRTHWGHVHGPDPASFGFLRASAGESILRWFPPVDTQGCALEPPRNRPVGHPKEQTRDTPLGDPSTS